MITESLQVEGMTCGHCVETVSKAVHAINGVKKVDVDLDGGKVTVELDEGVTGIQQVAEKIRAVGFETP